MIDVVKIILPATFSFAVGMGITPIVTHYLYKYKLWKKKPRELASDGRDASITKSFNSKEETRTPKMGGIIILVSSVITILVFWLASLLDGGLFEKLNFLSRGQTWLPLFTLIVGAVIGLFDDYLETRGTGDYFAGGLSLKKRLYLVFVISLIGAWWFYDKLEATSVLVPFVGEFDIGLFFIPFFSLIMLATYGGGIIDGVDGLAGGVLAPIFAAYGIIAFAQNQIDLAAFSIVIVGGLLAFLWFNIPPARFFMAETGTMSLTLTLTVIAFLTTQVIVLPVIAFLLYITAASSAFQLLSKKYRGGQRILLASPLHYHFLALGWPPYKVTMRYWILGVILSFVGVIIALVG
jgi:phospho-N-acetylmuramoyl-pentapeptide-transferase